MTDSIDIPCPRCGSVLEVSNEQMIVAAGKVRCGNCLQVFNGDTGEVEFVAPSVSGKSFNPFKGLRVRPMAGAEMPTQEAAPPGLLVHAAIILLVLLAVQFILHNNNSQSSSLSISSLNIQPHMEHLGALELNAVLSNASKQEQAYPDLLVHFSNRYGERLSQGIFPPSSYLRGELLGSESFPADTRVQLSLLLADPGPGAVNYGLQLYYVTEEQN